MSLHVSRVTVPVGADVRALLIAVASFMALTLPGLAPGAQHPAVVGGPGLPSVEVDLGVLDELGAAPPIPRLLIPETDRRRGEKIVLKPPGKTTAGKPAAPSPRATVAAPAPGPKLRGRAAQQPRQPPSERAAILRPKPARAPPKPAIAAKTAPEAMPAPKKAPRQPVVREKAPPPPRLTPPPMAAPPPAVAAAPSLALPKPAPVKPAAAAAKRAQKPPAPPPPAIAAVPSLAPPKPAPVKPARAAAKRAQKPPAASPPAIAAVPSLAPPKPAPVKPAAAAAKRAQKPPAASPAAAPGAPKQTAAVAPAAKSWREGSTLRIAFEGGSARLPDKAKAELVALARTLAQNSSLRLQLKAYAAGTKDTAIRARRLSLSRALSIRSYLIGQGLRSTRIDVRALGNKAEGSPADRVDLLVVRR